MNYLPQTVQLRRLLPDGHTQGDLHDQCHRVAEQHDPACHQVFPTHGSVKKVVWLDCKTLRDWRMAMSRLIIELGDRPGGHLREKAFTHSDLQARECILTNGPGGGKILVTKQLN